METQPQTVQTEAKPPRPRIRVSKVTLEGFKAFKEPFTFEIPPPLALDDPDVIVIGSSNGLGKTSLLEGIMLALLVPEDDRSVVDLDETTQRLLMSSGARRASITCWCSFGEERLVARADLLPGFGYCNGEDPEWPSRLENDYRVNHVDRLSAVQAATNPTPDPVVAPPVLYLHSYRAIRRGPLQMEELARPGRRVLGADRDRFKRDAAIAVLAAAGGVEGMGGEVPDAPRLLEPLDQRVRQFAGGQVARKLQLDEEGGLWLSVALPDGSTAPFDALSSGQKEIISTLFLIWEATRECPSVVLIDEPELHLNQAWHDDIMRMLFELAPWNQYIIATHSPEVMASVDPDRRRELVR